MKLVKLKIIKMEAEDYPIVPPPATMVVEGKKIVLYSASEEPLTRKIGF